MSRKLATIQTVKEIQAIEGADFIGLASFVSVGWTAVVKKDSFRVGDKCVFFEIDSIVPDLEQFDFLAGKRRIRTMKLKGVLSQGLALPLSEFEGVEEHFCKDYNAETWEYNEGEDLTAFLGVEQYEPPQSGQPGYSSGPPEGSAPFPLWIGVEKTDEERIQSNPALLDDLQGKPYVITSKLDGQSATFAWTEEEGLIVCSRNLWIQREDNSSFWQVGREIDFMVEISNCAFQGEICGPGIQGNKLGLDRLRFFVFNVFDPVAKRYLTYLEASQVCERCCLDFVPVVEKKTKFKHTKDSLLELARGNYPGTETAREGLVVRSLDGEVSFKVINNDFLIRNKAE